MKPFKNALILVIITMLAISVAAATVTDVSSTHWAYQSVIDLLDKGYLSAYPDNTFRGNEPVDRYTFASVVARMLREVQTGRVASSPEDLSTLTKLYQEFHEELNQLLVDFAKANDKIDELEKSIIVTKDEITRLQIDYNSFKPEIAKQIEAIFASMNTIKTNLEKQITDLGTILSTLSDDKASSEAVALAITSAIRESSNETLKEQEKLKTDIDALRTDLSSELVALKLDLSETDKKLEEELNALKTTLAMSGQNIDELVKRTDSTEETLSLLISDQIQATNKQLQETRLELERIKEQLAKVQDEVANTVDLRVAELEKDLEQAKQQIAVLELQLRDELQSNISSNFVRERTIENRLDKIEAQLQSNSESNDARLLALEKGRNFWWAGFGLSLVAIIVSIVGFTK